jgi:hypothetical protein
MNPQVEVMKLSSGEAVGRRPLDQLGDLFFAKPASAGTSGPLRVAPPRTAISQLVAEKVETPLAPQAAPLPSLPLLAILAGGLPPERRMALARAAARRLAASDCSALLVIFRGDRACLQVLGDGLAACDDADPGRKIDRLLAAVKQVMIVLPESAAIHLAADRQLPEHCVVLVTPDAESLVEAYRELKVATAVTCGLVPDVFVFDGSTAAAAEETYRRLARVSIAHLGGTPTFAGRCLDRLADAARECAAPQTVMDYAEAALVYERLRPLLERRRADGPAADRQADEPAGWGETDDELAEAATKCGAAQGATQHEAGTRQTTPPVAAVLEAVAPPSSRLLKTFTTWSPPTTAELLAAVKRSFAGLLPEARGLLDLDGVVRAAEQPDAIVIDSAGRPVAVLVAEDGDLTVLRRAAEARRWLGDYLKLLARAYPQAGLNAISEAGPSIVVAPAEATGELEALCPSEVELATWTGVAYGDVRGLLFRPVLRALDKVSTTAPLTPTPGATAACREPSRTAPSAAVPRANTSTAAEQRSRGTQSSECAEVPAVGTSPDDDLSADELSDLRTSFEIDELT